MQPLISPKKRISARIRRILAIIGLLLILGSILVLVSLHRTSEREQFRYDPPATLFAPPEVHP